jgi:hypothetical protein
VNQDGIEYPSESKSAHIAEFVAAGRIKLLAKREHRFGKIQKCAIEGSAESQCVTTGPRAQFEQSLGRAIDTLDKSHSKNIGLFGMISGGSRSLYQELSSP